MDPVTLVYYACVCGVLGVAAPGIPRRIVRFAIGIAVGLVAAACLPILRAALTI